MWSSCETRCLAQGGICIRFHTHLNPNHKKEVSLIQSNKSNYEWNKFNLYTKLIVKESIQYEREMR